LWLRKAHLVVYNGNTVQCQVLRYRGRWCLRVQVPTTELCSATFSGYPFRLTIPATRSGYPFQLPVTVTLHQGRNMLHGMGLVAVSSSLFLNRQKFELTSLLMYEVHKHEIFFLTFFAETETIWSQGPVTRDF
jgi:hypothetical protein